MPNCIVYGPRDVDVASIIRRDCPEATITRFDDERWRGGVMAIFPNDPTEILSKTGLYVTVLERDLNSVIWHPFLIKGAPASPAGTDERIAEIIQQRFNGRPTGEKTKFLIPVPVPSFGPTCYPETGRSGFQLKVDTVKKMEDVLAQNGIRVEIGLARW